MLPGQETLKADLEVRVRAHDLSEYWPEESLGYYLRWCCVQEPLSRETQMLWTTALAHHYKKNNHHPEFFSRYGLLEADSLSSMSEGALLEAVLDSVACRMQRVLKNNGGADVCPEQLPRTLCQISSWIGSVPERGRWM